MAVETTFDFHSTPGHLIRRAQQIAVAIFVEETTGFDLTPIQYALLAELAHTHTLDQVTLAAPIAVDVATLGQVAQRMAERGLLAREADVEDRRRKRLGITDRGRAVLAKINPQVAAAQLRILAPLDSREQADFCRLLAKLVHHNNQQSRAPMRRTGKTGGTGNG